MMTQREILDLLRPLLKTEGALFQKNKKVFARPAQNGEVIYTQTDDGLETSNTAQAGDFIVRNQTKAREEYIVPAYKFTKKYAPLRQVDHDWSEYQSLGKIIVVELTSKRLEELGLPEEFEFIAPWGEPMQAKAGDFLGGPTDFSEIYRLARKEFFETYEQITVH